MRGIKVEPKTGHSIQEVLVGLFHWCCHVRPKSSVIFVCAEAVDSMNWKIRLNTILDHPWTLSDIRFHV
jgi:hypothetical protein